MSDFMNKKNLLIITMVVSLILLSISVWWGGKERWEMAGINLELPNNASISAQYEKKLEAQPEAVVLKYNLSFFYYRQGRYSETRDLLKEALNSGESDDDLIKKAFYNMGNNLFRMSEKEENLEPAINLLKESLKFYKAFIEMENQDNRYSMLVHEKDEDVYFNYAVVRRRLKILGDKLESQKKGQEQQKKMYQLIKELVAQEKEIKKQLIALQKDPKNQQTNQKRDNLFIQRQENLKKLKIIKEKIQQLTNSQQQSPSTQGQKLKKI